MLEITTYRKTYRIPSNIDGNFNLGWVNYGVRWTRNGENSHLVFGYRSGDLMVIDLLNISEGEREELVFISELFIERLRDLKSKNLIYNMNDSFHSVLSDPELFRMRKIEIILK